MQHGDACGQCMARVKSAVGEGEGIPTEGEAASTPSAAADNSRKTLTTTSNNISATLQQYYLQVAGRGRREYQIP
jgi:hypothetical protein